MELWNAIFIASGSLGAMGALVLILTYVLFPDLRTPNRKLLLYLSVTDLAQALFFCLYLGDWMSNHVACRIHTVLGIVAAASCFFWTCSISVHVLVVTVFRRKSPVVWFHLFSWVLPLLLAGRYYSPWSDIRYEWPYKDGRLGWWVCLENSRNVMWEYSGPLVFSWLLTLVCYATTLVHLRRFAIIAEGATDELSLKFRLIPLLFIVQRAWSLFGLTYEAIGGWTGAEDPEPPHWVIYARSVSDPVQGLLNALLFGYMSPGIRRRWLDFLAGREWDPEHAPLNNGDDP
eukprot:TRINITY_DN2392_c0_g1_i1.p1 TRINITY_DN2392_c0_g1~~TRINITY_DN2392_c0_g1_i1.p1  ORF type:complete len:288 (-),score=57.87 TRINITY_DN2392_c0_g1_i1:236-1099(-)